jgi:alanine dehydrogenase
MSLVRPLREVRIYSPRSANRERLAAELKEQLGIDVRAVDDPRIAVRGALIVGCATNSLTPVLEADWLDSLPPQPE